MMPALLDRVCRQTLTDYLADPWCWPRETDLVVDLVTRIRAELPEGERKVSARLEKLGNRLHDTLKTTRLIPRVRSELKLRGDGLRVDIGIFHAQEVRCFLNQEGARDMSLKANESDMEGLLEVKLFPDLYLFRDEQPCRWFGDVLKLAELAPEAVRGVLLLDTSLPLEAVGITYAKRRNTTDLTRVVDESLPPWPLRPEPFVVEDAGRLVAFDPTDTPEPGGLYLWALATNGRWRPTFDGGSNVPVLPSAEVEPFCWKVQIA